jgi:hypothetical protein
MLNKSGSKHILLCGAILRIYLIHAVREAFVGAFAKLRKATVSFVTSVSLSVCPSTWNNSAPTGRTLKKFLILEYVSKICRENSSWIKSDKGRAMAQAVIRRPVTTEARGSVPGQVHVRFVVDKVALGQVFLRVVGFPLSILFHWCSINCKNW